MFDNETINPFWLEWIDRQLAAFGQSAGPGMEIGHCGI